MYFATKAGIIAAAFAACTVAATSRAHVEPLAGSVNTSQPASPQHINLVERLAAGKLRASNREVTKLQDSPDGVYVSATPGSPVMWLEGSDLADGSIEVDVRGRDVFQQSFLGIAFHGKDDNAYETVYLRPFNFRAEDPVRRQHAVQYMALPDYDWSRLRKEFPEEFENPVEQSIVPTDWVTLRVIVKGKTIQVYVGPVASPTLEIRKLGQHDRGMIGLWTGSNSDGAFRNLRVTSMK